MKIKIDDDVYAISRRLKYIDRDYFVLFDTISHHFEIHNHSQIDNTYCLTIPYNTLDMRTLEYVYRTRTTEIDNILFEIENDNKLIESTERYRAQSQFNDSLEDMFKRS